MELLGEVDLVVGGVTMVCIAVCVAVATLEWLFDKWFFSKYDRDTVLRIMKERREDHPRRDQQ